jgi:tRNA pseudouridine32 synthase/23S rRNA pseudouridine746 synthase
MTTTAASGLVTLFDPQPPREAWPARIPSPFAAGPPHPLARRAAEELQAQLRAQASWWAAALAGAERGTMLGVLVVGDAAGRVGYLRGFSGMVGGSWQVDGFVGPLFDTRRRDEVWPAGEAELIAFDRALAQVHGEAGAARAALAALEDGQRAAAGALAARLEDNRRGRQQRRAQIAGAALAVGAREAAMHALDRDSRADTVAQRRLRAEHRQARAPLAAAVAALEQRRLALKRQQAARSCQLLEHIFEGYQITSARGERQPLRALFAPATPPGGSGDCAAPKLFGHALAAGLRPLALAEFWWGEPPLAGGRLHGVYYPACRGKCGPVLAHMLDGLDVAGGGARGPLLGAASIAAGEPATVYEDEWLVVVDKPVGLLSVPGRSGLLQDSVATRLRERYPRATGPLLVHRLDLDVSGLLLAAKDAGTHRALQRLFNRREIDKRYLAVLDGALARPETRGTIDLALRVDIDDRPRQIHDPVHGKRAVTDWALIARDGARTRVALYPRSGRTHQLRVHAAHPLGLGLPIVGDRLYGRAPAGEQAGQDIRLLLHAEALELVHPQTGQRLSLVRPAPF